MITNEAEIRIALQAVLVTVLAFSGYWGCALVVMFILLPWKPIFAVSCYLAQPLVDWRSQKAHDRHEKGIAQIERELEGILHAPKTGTMAPVPHAHGSPATLGKLNHPPLPRPLESFKPQTTAGPAFQNMSDSAHGLAATLGIPPAIKSHVRNLPQGVFNNMDLEVDEVKFHGETADAFVRFKSSNVTGLVIRQRYHLRKSGDHWEVESRQPANGASKAPPQSVNRLQMRLT
jgi:hypothetical protein